MVYEKSPLGHSRWTIVQPRTQWKVKTTTPGPVLLPAGRDRGQPNTESQTCDRNQGLFLDSPNDETRDETPRVSGSKYRSSNNCHSQTSEQTTFCWSLVQRGPEHTGLTPVRLPSASTPLSLLFNTSTFFELTVIIFRSKVTVTMSSQTSRQKQKVSFTVIH